MQRMKPLASQGKPARAPWGHSPQFPPQQVQQTLEARAAAAATVVPPMVGGPPFVGPGKQGVVEERELGDQAG